jgi:predicted glycogen debranching enzyme
MFFGKSYWKTFEQGIQREWLMTNGIGGFSCSSIIGANSRRYHGLLTASLNPPVERFLVLSSINESIIFSNEKVHLYSFKTPDFTAHGEYHLESFQYNYIPEYNYRVGSMVIQKRICLLYGKNQVAIVYTIHNAINSTLRITPLVNFRDYHHLSQNNNMSFTSICSNRKIFITPYNMDKKIMLECSDGVVVEKPCYFYNMDYEYERERGMDSTEDHYIPGYYDIELLEGKHKTITLVCSFNESIDLLDGEKIIAQEIQRQKDLLQNTKDIPFLKHHIIAADKFIVQRKSTYSKTIIAGYPWFTDWGRDTMIAFTGLTLSTNRFDDARDILYTFSKYEKYGLIPNVFPDGNNEPAYNTVDAALWFFEAVYKYIQYTSDWNFVKKEILSVLKRIISSYKEGTIFNIKMNKDFLISAGDENTQLTWMDAKVGDWVVTPRHGKAVEINALWYNAVMVMAYLTRELGENCNSYVKLAQDIKDSFIELFWNENEGCLYDVVNLYGKDDKIRPNQILSVSLSFPVVEGWHAKSIVNTVYNKLYTAYGLRSLYQKDPCYRGIYIGGPLERDGAYHQGTVWTWPLGQFITAYARVYKDDNNLKNNLERFFIPFEDHFKDACLGSISEIFDGNEPLIARGCFAQAWSVAEILRAYTENFLPLL